MESVYVLSLVDSDGHRSTQSVSKDIELLKKELLGWDEERIDLVPEFTKDINGDLTTDKNDQFGYWIIEVSVPVLK